MARQIDPSDMNDQDRQYVQERPWMIGEFRRQGFGDEMDDLVNGVKTVKAPKNSRDVTTSELSLGAAPHVQDGPAPDGVIPASDDEPDDYDSWTKDELRKEIDDRNEAMDDGEESLAVSGDKQALIDRLRADDQAILEANKQG